MTGGASEMISDAELVAGVGAVLASVPDPEIPAVTVVDLGISRGVRRRPDGSYAVVLTPTYTGCPATLAIEASVRSALDAAGYGQVAVVTELSPAWTTDWITDEGREKLRAYGIAPPERGAAAASLRPEVPPACPQCRSLNTQEVSRFGSTPCKSLWRCLGCAEPFDRFKCL